MRHRKRTRNKMKQTSEQIKKYKKLKWTKRNRRMYESQTKWLPAFSLIVTFFFFYFFFLHFISSIFSCFDIQLLFDSMNKKKKTKLKCHLAMKNYCNKYAQEANWLFSGIYSILIFFFCDFLLSVLQANALNFIRVFDSFFLLNLFDFIIEFLLWMARIFSHFV